MVALMYTPRRRSDIGSSLVLSLSLWSLSGRSLNLTLLNYQQNVMIMAANLQSMYLQVYTFVFLVFINVKGKNFRIGQ